MFAVFNEAAQPKTPFAKYSIEFNAYKCVASNSVFEAVRQTLHITVFEKVCGQTKCNRLTHGPSDPIIDV